MFGSEAAWLRDRLLALDPDTASPILNIGSSSRIEREVTQPHMKEILFDPLSDRGFKVLHCDLFPAEGVDLAGDLLDDAYLAEVRGHGARAVLCNNFYEHVERPEEYAKRILSVVGPGAHLLISVPKSYPYHRMPIDTLYRPSPDDIALLHPGTDVLDKAVVPASRYRDQVRARPSRLARDAAAAVRAVANTRSIKHVRFRWWNKPYQVSAVHLVKH